ncbi:hypothetical protein STEG23_018178 [Scotinomys teguina]
MSCFMQIPLFPVRFIRLAPLLTTVLNSYHSRRHSPFPVRHLSPCMGHQLHSAKTPTSRNKTLHQNPSVAIDQVLYWLQLLSAFRFFPLLLSLLPSCFSSRFYLSPSPCSSFKAMGSPLSSCHVGF